MKKEFLVNISILLGLNLVIKPLYVFGLERGVHDRLGNESFELYLSLFSLAVIFQIINDLGIQSYTSKTLSEDANQINTLFSNFMGFKLMLGLIYFLMLSAAAYVLNFDKVSIGLLYGIGFVNFLSGLLQFLRSNLAGLGRYRTDSLLSAIDRSILIVILGLILYGNLNLDFDLSWFIKAQIVSMSISVLIGSILLRPYLKEVQWKLDRTVFLNQVKSSLPYAIAVLLMALYSRMDQVMLERILSGSGEGGVYGMSYRLLDVLNMIGFLFAGLLLPMFSRMHAKGEDVKGLLALSGKILLGGAVILAFSVSSVSFELLDLMYPSLNVTAANAEVTQYLMGSLVMMSGGYIFGTYLVATDRLKRLNILFLASLVLNFTLNILWIKEQGAVGAAKATLITQSLVFLVEFIWVSSLRLVVHKDLTLRIALLVLFMVLLVMGDPLVYMDQFLFKLTIYISVGLAGGFVFGLFPLNEFIQILKSKEKH